MPFQVTWLFTLRFLQSHADYDFQIRKIISNNRVYHFDSVEIDIFNTRVKTWFWIISLKIIFLNGVIRKLYQRNFTNQFIKKCNIDYECYDNFDNFNRVMTISGRPLNRRMISSTIFYALSSGISWRIN